MWVGARPSPASEALMMSPEDLEAFAAQAAKRRENLRRAMEVAFAPPLTTAGDVIAPDASVEVAAAAEAALQAAVDPADVEELATTFQIENLEEEVIASSDEEFSVEVAAEVEELSSPQEPEVAVTEDFVTEAIVEEPVAEEIAEEQLVVDEPVIEEALEEERPVLFQAEEVAEEAAAEADETALEVVEPQAIDLQVIESAPSAEEAPDFEVAPEAEPAAMEPEVELSEMTAPEAPLVVETFKPEVVASDAAPKAARAKKAKAAKAKAAPAPKKKAAPKKKSATLEDEAWLSDAVAFSLSGQWSEAGAPPVDEAGAMRLEEFRTKAGEGALTVWGRASADATWEPIKASYWKSANVEPMSFVEGREHVATEAKKSKGKAPAIYSALKVSKAQVAEIWQPGAMPIA